MLLLKAGKDHGSDSGTEECHNAECGRDVEAKLLGSGRSRNTKFDERVHHDRAGHRCGWSLPAGCLGPQAGKRNSYSVYSGKPGQCHGEVQTAPKYS